MSESEKLKRQLDEEGRVWLRQAIAEDDLLLFDKLLSENEGAGQRLHSSSGLVKALSSKASLMNAILRLDPQAKPVRVVGFNKSEKANWSVPWH